MFSRALLSKLLLSVIYTFIFSAYSIKLYAIPSKSSQENFMGINILAPLDYSKDRLYANVISTSRSFVKGPDVNDKDAGPAPVDVQGWPTSDFSFYVWSGIDKMNGTYTLTFKGRANVIGNPVGKIHTSYNHVTNTSKGTFQYKDSLSGSLTLQFTDTKRNTSSAHGSGVTSIKLMRPIVPGSLKSYPPSTLFADPLKALIKKFSVIRYMDFLATNSNLQSNWNDRPLPSWPSFNRNPDKAYGWQGIGGPWEHVILLANETEKDAWINIPARATDEYVRNVALMFAYGSDGINPYKGPQKNPVYPPLKSNLKIYVEYSNELWNTAPEFQQSNDNCQSASDELVRTGGNSPLNWDKSWNEVTFNRSIANPKWNFIMCYRRMAKRSVEISNIFRNVFGDDAMMTRIRPELMTQLRNPGGTLFYEMKMLLEYYDNMGGNFFISPHPPNYFFYGAGGSAYYGTAKGIMSLDSFFTQPSMNPDGFTPHLQNDAKLVAAMGLKRVAYEGGPSLFISGVKKDDIAAQAVKDPRMTQAIVRMHNAWSNNGGDLLMYFTSSWDYKWGFTNDIYNLSTPKLLAIDALNDSTRAPLSLGTPVPGRIYGKFADTCSRRWNCNPIMFWEHFTADGSSLSWASYTFRSNESKPWQISLSLTSASNNSSVEVYVDGIPIGSQRIKGETLSFITGVINSGLHGVIIRAASGTFALNSVAVGINQ